MDHVRVHREKASSRNALVVAASLLLAGALLATSAGAATVARAAGSEECPASVGSVPLVDEEYNLQESGGQQVVCLYKKYRKKVPVWSASLSLQWVESDSQIARMIDGSNWCEPKETDATSPDCDNNCRTYPYKGQGMMLVHWSWSAPEGKSLRAKTVRTVDTLAAAFAHRVEPCEAGVSDFVPAAAPRTTTIELTGDRITRLEDQGGIGAIIELTPDERDALVASMDGERKTAEPLGRRGRVVAVGTVATATEDDKVVSVTVEIVDGAVEVPPEPDTPGKPDVPPEPDTPGKPDVPPEPDTPGKPDVPPEPARPSSSAAVDSARDLADTLLADLDSQLDAVVAGDRDSVDFSADLIDELTALEAVADKVKAVRLEKDRVVIETKGFGTVLIYPVVKKGTVDIDLWTVVKKVGSLEVKFPLSLDFLKNFNEELPTRVEQEIGDLNTEVFSRDLVVTGVDVTPAGISAKVAEYDG